MELVIGGIAQGKRTYARSRGFVDEQMGRALFDGKPVLLALEELLREGPFDARALSDVQSRAIVICNEVGAGVVPLDTEERAWRELVGRTCAQLAQDAERVTRLVCGVPVALKGEELL